MMVNIAIVLAGGVGSRLGADIPKQYIEVGGKPVIMYCLEKFEKYTQIDSVVLVANEEWMPFIWQWIEKCGIHKVSAIVPGGISRQHSVLNALHYLDEQDLDEKANVLIHDAARPGVTTKMLDELIAGVQTADAVTPVIPVNDTLYFSRTGTQVDGMLNRSEVFAAQSPEAFRFSQYYRINRNFTDEQLMQVRGCAESAYQNGLQIKLIPGDENNFKITTKEDLERFTAQVNGMEA